jgi:hypothetical protein
MAVVDENRSSIVGAVGIQALVCVVGAPQAPTIISHPALVGSIVLGMHHHRSPIVVVESIHICKQTARKPPAKLSQGCNNDITSTVKFCQGLSLPAGT